MGVDQREKEGKEARKREQPGRTSTRERRKAANVYVYARAVWYMVHAPTLLWLLEYLGLATCSSQDFSSSFYSSP